MIPIDRERIMTALFNRLCTAYPFRTTGRRLLLWSKVTNQPALFLRNIGDIYDHTSGGILDRVTLRAEIFIYSNAGRDPVEAPGIALNELVSAVEQVLLPDNAALGTLTLGGLVEHVWLEGDSDFDPGDLDGQAKAALTVHILVP